MYSLPILPPFYTRLHYSLVSSAITAYHTTPRVGLGAGLEVAGAAHIELAWKTAVRSFCRATSVTSEQGLCTQSCVLKFTVICPCKWGHIYQFVRPSPSGKAARNPSPKAETIQCGCTKKPYFVRVFLCVNEQLWLEGSGDSQQRAWGPLGMQHC